MLAEAKERAEGYVEALQDIITEQERQPLLMSAEDVFSKRSAEEITERLATVAKQIKDNANITHVSVNGMLLTVEEYTRLAQQALNNIEKAQEDAEKKSEKLSEDSRQTALQRIDVLNDIVDAEVERNLTEEELLEKRLNDKLRELDLDKDVTAMTEQELDARNALLAKYNDDVAKLREEDAKDEKAKQKENFDKRLQFINDRLAMELLVKETAMLNELRNEELTEEEKLAIQEKYQKESLELQRDALIKQIKMIKATLGDGKTSEALEQLRNALAGINLEIANLGKDDGEPKTLADRLGLNEDQVAKINQGIQGVEAGLNAMSQFAQARASERLSKVDQLLQQGVLNEEQAERKKEQIKKDVHENNKRLTLHRR